MLATIGFIILVLWIIGLVAHIAGGFINLLLVLGVIFLIVHLMRGHSHPTV